MYRNTRPRFQNNMSRIKSHADIIGYECISREGIKRSVGVLSTDEEKALSDQTPVCTAHEQEIMHIIGQTPTLKKPLNEVKKYAMLDGACRFFNDHIKEQFPDGVTVRQCKQVPSMLEKAEAEALRAFEAEEESNPLVWK